MSQSLVANYLHIIFSTKHRAGFIQAPYEQELHSYLGGICNNMGCNPIKIGGYTDHIHILCKLSKKITLVNLMEEVKSHSSKWIKTKDESLKIFYCQNARLDDAVGQGYGAFSVNPSEIEKVILYISNQCEHHKKISFQDEYRAFLKKYKVEYDERFVWD